MTHKIALENMIKQQLITNQINDESILTLFETIPREKFIDKKYQSLAYCDAPIPLAHQQKTLTPVEEASILQALNLSGDEVVLEVGTGCGYLTALLANKANKVYSVDIYSDFTAKAKQTLDKLKIENAELLTGDASRGWMEKGPYDVIVITAGIETVGDHLRVQLLKGGKLFAFIGKPPAQIATLYQLDKFDKWHKTALFDTCVTPLISKQKETFSF